MALPKIELPTFTFTLPASKKKVKYRPFTVREEKILLMAAQSQEEDDIVNAIKQIINNCLVTEVDVDNLATYEIEYIFKNLRARSVNNVIEMNLIDDEDGDVYTVEVDLDEIEVTFDDKHEYIVNISDDIRIMLKDPSYDDVKRVSAVDNEEDGLMEMIMSIIDKILVGEEEVLLLKDHTRKEQEEFINSFSSKNMQSIKDFLNTLPKLSHTIEYTRKDGTKVEKRIEGIQSFFT